MSHWCYDVNTSEWYAIDCFVDDVWMQFNVGQRMHMMSPKNKKQKVTTGKISGVDKFHFKFNPDFCYSHEAGDQWIVEDVVGGNTL